MKKQLLAGAASLVMAATPVFGVFAEAPQAGTAGGTFMGTHDVEVGEVDETVYSVDINWGDLTFDWKYDAETNEYNFQPKMQCVSGAVNDEEHFIAYRDNFGLYTGACGETKVTEADNYASGTTYYYYTNGYMVIKDYTTNGKLKASASFSATDDYSWVAGKIGNWSTECVKAPEENMTCARHFTENPDGDFYYNSTQTDTDGSYRLLLGSLNLEKIPNIGNTTSITKDDKIGTVTIDITPDLN